MKLTTPKITLPTQLEWRTRIEMRHQQFLKDLRRYVGNNDAFIRCSWCWTHLHLQTAAVLFVRTIDLHLGLGRFGMPISGLYEPFCARCASQFKQSQHHIKEMTLEQGIEWYRVNLVRSICEG